MNHKNDPPSQNASADFDSEESRILEGEIVGKAPEKHTPPKGSLPPEFKVFTLAFEKLKRNCLFASIAFFALTILAINFHNGWLFLLALLLPPWIFSRK